MADADIIPIGNRGRPGRGSRTSPSAAARALAAPPAASRAPAVPQRLEQPVEPQRVTPPTTADKPTTSTRVTKSAKSTKTTKPKQPSTSKQPTQPKKPKKPPAPRRPVLVTQDEPPADGETTRPLEAADVADAIADAAKATFGEVDWQRRMAEVLAFTRRRLTGDYEVDEFGFDVEITERFIMSALRPIAEKWFRIEVRGIDNIPAEAGALVVSNHSGTVPIDGLMTALVIHDHSGRFLRMLGADLVFGLPFVGELARKGGATIASSEDAERMLSRGDLVGVWPEGFKGVGKPFSERYKLQRFGRGGFVSAALRTQVPIVPCSVVGAEEIYPLVGNIPALARLLGVPYIPITPFFPWLGPLGMIPLPSKWLIEFGEPVRTDSYGDTAADDPMLVFNVTDQVRETIQQTLYTLLMQRTSVFS
ncbi:MAG TPA: lysophospholipid acyltransferase family protein [Nocardioidaceae bacterium]|nr:lysophospholipid acyltransferase family protein [Nocardioidaceae bacterium]